MAVGCNCSLAERHSCLVSLVVADIADMGLALAPAPALVHTYSVQWADTDLVVDNSANIAANAAASGNSQTPGMNRCVVSILDIQESLILVHSIRFLLSCT